MGASARYAPRLRQHVLTEFAAALRELRERAGLPTFRTMSRRGGDVSAATLCRAESGEHIPSLLTTFAYVEACDGDLHLWEDQHRDLMLSLHGDATLKPVAFVPWRDYFDTEKPPAPPTVKVLRKEMRRLWISSDMTLREISAKTAGFHSIVGKYPLGASTISELCNPDRTQVPRRRTIHGFLRAVDAPAASIEQWLAARNQLAAKQDARMVKAETEAAQEAATPTIPVRVPGTTGDRIVESGQQVLARFRRLRNDLAHDSPASTDRVARILRDLGVPVEVASLAAHDQTMATAFVMDVDREMHKIMSEGRLPSAAAPMALELAVHRTSARHQVALDGRRSLVALNRDGIAQIRREVRSHLEAELKEQARSARMQELGLTTAARPRTLHKPQGHTQAARP